MRFTGCYEPVISIGVMECTERLASKSLDVEWDVKSCTITYSCCREY